MPNDNSTDTLLQQLLLTTKETLTDHKQAILISLLISYYCCKTNLFRSTKKFIIPTCTVIIIYRNITCNSSNNKTMLTILHDLLHNNYIINNKNLLLLCNCISDSIGLFSVIKLLDMTTNMISNCDLTTLLSLKSLQKLQNDILAIGYDLIKDISFVKNILKKEQDKLESDFDKDLKSKSRQLGSVNTMLPNHGMDPKEILSFMKNVTSEEDTKWENGRISGAVYHGKHKHIDLLNEAFGRYSIANPLHPDIWPSLMKYEAEIIAMTASLVRNGVETVCGATTSVSVTIACKQCVTTMVVDVLG